MSLPELKEEFERKLKELDLASKLKLSSTTDEQRGLAASVEIAMLARATEAQDRLDSKKKELKPQTAKLVEATSQRLLSKLFGDDADQDPLQLLDELECHCFGLLDGNLEQPILEYTLLRYAVSCLSPETKAEIQEIVKDAKNVLYPEM